MTASPIDPLETGGPLESGGAYRPLSEINVTPFVDVMLVLLIIFMVTAPLMTAGIKVTLPKTQVERTALPKEPIVVSLDAGGRVYLKTEALADDEILPRLQALAAITPDRVVLVRGDQALAYGRLVQVMDLVSRAGFSQVSLISEARPRDKAP